ncbi:MAG: bifunctional adenosylcobinamide kinase/adenosylcobinamide-phosphate guanylyltransferase [Thermotaleaceae bacterium]
MDNKIILVTGGARSGKSSYAESLAKDALGNTAYLATAIAFDQGMKDRIKKHKESRPGEWTTYEAYRDIYQLIPEIAKSHSTLLLDCMTIMVTNLMFDHEPMDWDTVSHEEIDKIEEGIKIQIKKLLEACREQDLKLIVVTNEVGMSIVPENRLSRIFRDMAGRMNQIIAQEADEVYLVVCGLPIKIK